MAKLTMDAGRATLRVAYDPEDYSINMIPIMYRHYS